MGQHPLPGERTVVFEAGSGTAYERGVVAPIYARVQAQKSPASYPSRRLRRMNGLELADEALMTLKRERKELQEWLAAKPKWMDEQPVPMRAELRAAPMTIFPDDAYSLVDSE